MLGHVVKPSLDYDLEAILKAVQNRPGKLPGIRELAAQAAAKNRSADLEYKRENDKIKAIADEIKAKNEGNTATIAGNVRPNYAGGDDVEVDLSTDDKGIPSIGYGSALTEDELKAARENAAKNAMPVKDPLLPNSAAPSRDFSYVTEEDVDRVAKGEMNTTMEDLQTQKDEGLIDDVQKEFDRLYAIARKKAERKIGHPTKGSDSVEESDTDGPNTEPTGTGHDDYTQKQFDNFFKKQARRHKEEGDPEYQGSEFSKPDEYEDPDEEAERLAGAYEKKKMEKELKQPDHEKTSFSDEEVESATTGGGNYIDILERLDPGLLLRLSALPPQSRSKIFNQVMKAMHAQNPERIRLPSAEQANEINAYLKRLQTSDLKQALDLKKQRRTGLEKRPDSTPSLAGEINPRIANTVQVDDDFEPWFHKDTAVSNPFLHMRDIQQARIRLASLMKDIEKHPEAYPDFDVEPLKMLMAQINKDSPFMTKVAQNYGEYKILDKARDMLAASPGIAEARLKEAGDKAMPWYGITRPVWEQRNAKLQEELAMADAIFDMLTKHPYWNMSKSKGVKSYPSTVMDEDGIWTSIGKSASSAGKQKHGGTGEDPTFEKAARSLNNSTVNSALDRIAKRKSVKDKEGKSTTVHSKKYVDKKTGGDKKKYKVKEQDADLAGPKVKRKK